MVFRIQITGIAGIFFAKNENGKVRVCSPSGGRIFEQYDVHLQNGWTQIETPTIQPEQPRPTSGGYSVEVVADTQPSIMGVRLTTMIVRFPRFILSQFNTHRAFSRCTASSRAISTERLVRDILADPYVPASLSSNKRGMQAGEPLSEADQHDLRAEWLDACESACDQALAWSKRGVHKQWANRLLEPFMWTTVIVSATEWNNFFALRCHHAAQPEMQTLACMMRDAINESRPKVAEEHVPFWDANDNPHVPNREERYLIAAARCARISYLNHKGERNMEDDLRLAHQLLADRHMSPFEHIAFVQHGHHPSNFRAPWAQLRHLL